MRIEDRDLRDLFKIESEEHLQRLDSGLLQLEKDLDDKTVLEEMFREAHSLKGGARMLSLREIEKLAHCFESILGRASKGESLLKSATIDHLLESLDAMRKLVNEAVTGEPSNVSVDDVLAILQSALAPGSLELMETQLQVGVGQPATEADQVADATAKPRRPDLLEATEANGPRLTTADAGDHAFRIGTMRVATQKLDALMPLLGELNVTKNRVTHYLVKIDEIIRVWEKLKKPWFGFRIGLNSINLPSREDRLQKLNDQLRQQRGLIESLGILLDSARAVAYENSSRLEQITAGLEEGVRSIRLLPFSTVFNLFPRMVRDLARSQSKDVQLIIDGGDITADKRVIEEIKDPLMHLIRNAVDHGIEAPEDREGSGKTPRGAIYLIAYQTATNIFIELKDDGRGLDLEAIRRIAIKRKLLNSLELNSMTPEELSSLIFVSGFSTSPFVTDLSGRGVGLDVVRSHVERLKGTIQISSIPNLGCSFKIQLPITMTTARALLVEACGRKYSILVEYVEGSFIAYKKDIFTVEGRRTIILDERSVSVAPLADLLELQSPRQGHVKENSVNTGDQNTMPCVILAVGPDRIGLMVDELIDEQEIVLKPQSPLLKGIRNISGATILGTGEVCLLLNPQDLIQSVRRKDIRFGSMDFEETKEKTNTILVAEDSLTTRTQMKRILERDGYEVVLAVDGLDAFNKIGSRAFDALVSDIIMPNMDGLTLTANLRQNPKYKELPIILVSSLASEEDRKRGLEVGANAYITKPAFDQKLFLETLQRLI